MAKFLLLLQDKPELEESFSPEEMGAVIGEYVAWRDRIAGQGKFVSGEKLQDEGGRHMSLADGEVRVVDGPYSEAKEVMGGFYMIEASDYEEAVTLTSDCPHLKYGLRIEVRQVHELNV